MPPLIFCMCIPRKRDAAACVRRTRVRRSRRRGCAADARASRRRFPVRSCGRVVCSTRSGERPRSEGRAPREQDARRDAATKPAAAAPRILGRGRDVGDPAGPSGRRAHALRHGPRCVAPPRHNIFGVASRGGSAGRSAGPRHSLGRQIQHRGLRVVLAASQGPPPRRLPRAADHHPRGKCGFHAHLLRASQGAADGVLRRRRDRGADGGVRRNDCTGSGAVLASFRRAAQTERDTRARCRRHQHPATSCIAAASLSTFACGLDGREACADGRRGATSCGCRRGFASGALAPERAAASLVGRAVDADGGMCGGRRHDADAAAVAFLQNAGNKLSGADLTQALPCGCLPLLTPGTPRLLLLLAAQPL